MPGKKIGYIRVSSFEQNTERQLDGIKLDKCFIDKASGKDTNRPQLNELLSYVREDDTIFVHSMDRLARNLDDLRDIVKNLTAKNITINFIKESLIFTGDDKPMSKLLLSIMGAFGEFERTLIKERQLEGIALAKKRGVYQGRNKALSDNQVFEIKEMINKKVRKVNIAKHFNISRETLYKYIRNNAGA